MDTESFTLLVQSRNCRQDLTKGELVLEFNLPASYLFKTHRYVRLLAATGLEEPTFVHLSFASLTPFDSTYRRHIAVVAPSTLPGPPSLVDGNFISSISQISLAKLSGDPFEATSENLVFYLQVAAPSWFKNVGTDSNA